MFNGAILVGASERQGGEPFFAIDPSTGAKGAVAFHNASAADVADACALADAAFESFSTLTPEARAAFLEAVADRPMAIGALLITPALTDTGLHPRPVAGCRGPPTAQPHRFTGIVPPGHA